jgi:hypothetical protein
LFVKKNDPDGMRRAIVESPRDVPYGDINLQECMYSMPTISGQYSGQRVHTFLQIYISIWYISRRFDNMIDIKMGDALFFSRKPAIFILQL